MTAPSTERAKKRPKRTPLGQRNRLSLSGVSIPKDMVPRIINDKEDRIAQALEAGYQFVMSDGKLGDVRCADASKMGAYVTKSVGNGVIGFLMAIPKEFYDEDQRVKQDRVDDSEKAMRRPDPGTKLSHEGKPGDGTAYGEGLTDT